MLELKTCYTLSQVPYLTYDVLEDYAERIVADFAPERLSNPGQLDVDRFVEFYLGLPVEFHRICYDRKVLGMTAFNDGHIDVANETTGLPEKLYVKAGTIVIDTSLTYAKGGRGIHRRLLHLENPVLMNLKKIYKLMNKYGLKCPIRKANPYRRIAQALKTSNIADNILNREFEEHGVRTVLLTDITYIRRKYGDFSYLSAIKDAGSKEILAYVASPSLEVDFVLETVEILIANHGTELKTDTLLHSDQGCHYTSYAFIDLLKDKRLRQSMSRKTNCCDNAPQESFFGHV
jgi:transposase InsO family protein